MSKVVDIHYRRSVPSNWKSTSIISLGRFLQGTGFPEIYQGEKSQAFPFYKVSDFNLVRNSKYLKDYNNSVSEKIKKKLGATIIPKGSVAFAKVGAALLLNRRRITIKDSLIDNNCAALHPYNGVDLEFLYQTLLNINFRNYVQEGAVPSINQKVLDRILVHIPKSIGEQQKVASILKGVDSTIDKTKQLIEKYNKIKQGLMYDLFTKGIDKNGNIRNEETHKFKDSEVGRIPEEWDVKELGEIGKILVSNVDKKTKNGELCVKLCNYMDVYSNEYIDSTLDFMEASATYNEIRKFNLKIGDVIFTKDSETPDDIAVPAIVIENIDNLICGYHLAIIKPKEEIIHGFFVMKCLMLKSVNKHFSKLASGSTRFGLTMGAISTAKIPVPSEKEEQERIVNILKSIDKKIWSEQAYLEKLIKIKTSLMQDLLSGKVRGKVAV